MMMINKTQEPDTGQENYAGSGRSQKPKPEPGAYVCKIMGCEEGVTRNGNPVMHINVDIYEGEFANYYRDLYDRSRFEPKRWGCVYNIYTPVEPWQQKKINRFIDAVEMSNPGYKWDNDWNGLIGKLIGLSFQNTQYRSFTADDGREVPSGWKVKPKDPYYVEEIRMGSVKAPSDKPLPENQTSGRQNGFNQVPDFGGQQSYAVQSQVQPVQEQVPQYSQPAGSQNVPQGTPFGNTQTAPQSVSQNSPQGEPASTPQNMQSPAGSVDSFRLLDDDEYTELPF